MNKYKNLKEKKQITISKVRITFFLIFLLTIFSGFIVFPNISNKIPGNNYFNKFKIHLGLDLQGGTHLVYQADVSSFDNNEKKESVEGIKDIIERRVNAYGVSEPVVQTNYNGNNYRIIVELAGVKDVNEAIKMIGETPLLEFKLQKGIINKEDPENKSDIKIKAEEILEKVKSGEDFSILANKHSEDLGSKDDGGNLPWVIKGEFVPEFDKVIFDELKVGEISNYLIESQFGYHIIKKIDERLNEQGKIEVHSAHILFQKPNADFDNIEWENTNLSGKDLKKAQLIFDPNTQNPLVSLEFNKEGKETFTKITENNIGKPVAIFLDGIMISAPIVQEKITEGKAIISGNFSVQEAKLMVRRLNSGALPVPIKIISQQTIGASLGEDSVQKSLLAGIIGLVTAAIFMILFYRFLGLIAVLALFVYTMLTLALFEMIPVTMTLAGVAGFILSIGMAVDANILIFERTKEELYNGKSLNSSIENGFLRAWSSIRDSNISSLITCLILAWFGSSIIKGFAITLAIGIIVSMFSAIIVTRTFLRIIVNKRLENKKYWFGINKK